MIHVLRPGLFSSVQDFGRIGFRNSGVPSSGPMDGIAAMLGNAILNNDQNDAQLEISMIGPKLEFQIKTKIAITGANICPMLNNKPIYNYKVYIVNSGDVLSFGQCKKGVFAYISVFGGFQSEMIMGSRSFFKGITRSTLLKKGDRLLINELTDKSLNTSGSIRQKTDYFSIEDIACMKGPEFDLFDQRQMRNVLTSKHSISKEKNRMGYRLNEQLLPHDKSILTSPVLPGTVQLMPAGNCVVLMRDAQTTGGYPRILQLFEETISALSQKRAGDFIRFQLIN